MSTQNEIRANAYVDGELDPYEEAALLEELARNPVRGREVAELTELKRLVRLAFHDIPDAPRQPAIPACPPSRTGLRCALGGALAAALLLAAFGIGWVAHGSGILGQRLTAFGGTRLAAQTHETPGVLLHLASFHDKDVEATLRRTQELLERDRRSGLKVELIVSGLALQFLRSGFFPYSDEFAQLMDRYPNLRVVACGDTLDAFKEQGKSLRLLKGVNVAPSAVQEVVRRLREGWVYVDA